MSHHISQIVNDCRPFKSVVLVWLVTCSALPAAEPEKSAAAGTTWQSMFDGKTLGKWEVVKKVDFENHGKVRVEKGSLVLESGIPATGVRWGGKFPKTDYELTLEGKRTAGNDFFCGLSFPVNDGSLTLILGGWGGWVVGLSCIDGRYAIDNETCQAIEFEQDRWYRVRVRVTKPGVEVWVDNKRIINVDTEDRLFAVSEEMQPCLPVGVATWNTGSAFRKIRYRKLTEQVDAAKP